MTNAITEVPAVSAQTLETVLGTGDLSKLSTQQRVEYYAKTCQTLGLNPLTRPFRFLALNGQIQLYATRDCTDQLRRVNGITLHVVDKAVEAGVYSVTVRARDKHGREDEDMGAVVLPQGGESRANALMKAITKAKRRVTLSICGLGLTDESELDTMPGARVFDAEDEPPVAPIRTVSERQAINDAVPLRAAAASTPRAERVVDPTVYDTPPKPKPQPLPRNPAEWNAWMDAFAVECTSFDPATDTRADLEALTKTERFKAAYAAAPPAVRRDIDRQLAATHAELPEKLEPADETDADADSAAEPAHA